MGTDKTYVGVKEANKHFEKKVRSGCESISKATVTGVKDQATNRVAAERMRSLKVDFDADVCTDESSIYRTPPSALPSTTAAAST